MPTAGVRTTVSKLEIALGIVLVVVVATHFGWCSWSVPLHGVITAHGRETRVCHWAASILATGVGIIAVLSIASGAVSYWQRRNRLRWLLAHLPAGCVLLWLGVIALT